MDLNVAICLDIDRDAPFAVSGIPHGVCLPYHDLSPKIWKDPEKFVLKGTLIGLKQLLTIFNEYKLPFNFFIEASIIERLFEQYPLFKKVTKDFKCDFGLHGLYHEDISGEQTGISFSKTQEEGILSQAIAIFKNSFGLSPKGYRAPYLKFSPNTHDILSDKGFLYDSSVIQTAKIIPQVQYNEVVQVPILRYETNSTPFISYFWSLFEETRSLNQIISLYSEIIKNTKEYRKKVNSEKPFILTLNLHPWHLVYSVRRKEYLGKQRMESNVESLIKIVEVLMKEKGVNFIQISKII